MSTISFHRFENEFVDGSGFEWTVSGRDLFFRPPQASVEVVWCLLGRSDYAHSLLNEQRAKRAQEKILREVDQRVVWRYFPYSDNEELLFRSRYGFIRFNHEQKQTLVRFELPGRFRTLDKLDAPDEQIRKMVCACEGRIESIRLALQDSPEGRGWLAVRWPWGTHDELRQLIRAMGTIIRQPQHARLRWVYHVKTDFSGSITLASPFWQGRLPERRLYEPFLRCLRTHFPVESEELVLCDEYGGKYKRQCPLVLMSAGPPSQHERMEAILVWRDFLQDKVSPEETEHLLNLHSP